MRLVIDQLVSKNGKLTYQAALKAYEKLTKDQNEFLCNGWSAEEIFWSRYFWIKLYENICPKSSHRDAGLEQSIFKLLETPEPKCEPNWDYLEKVENLTKKQAIHWNELSETDIQNMLA